MENWFYYIGNRYLIISYKGYGIQIRDIIKYPLLFSERNGHHKGIYLVLFKWLVGINF